MLNKSINFEWFFISRINSSRLSVISAGSKKCNEFAEFLKTYSIKSVPFKFDAQFVRTTADEELKTDNTSSSSPSLADSIDSGPKLQLSPTSLSITFETEKEESVNSNIVVNPCLPFLTCKRTCEEN